MVDRTVERHNYPKGFEKKPWCPHTEVVNICALLTGEELTPQTFCYEQMRNPIYSDGAIHTLEHATFYPEASCAKINNKLHEQLDLVINCPSNLVNETAADKTIQDNITKRKEIINRWREKIFKTYYSTPDGEKNGHPRQLEYTSQLTEEKIIDRVKQLAKSLRQIVGPHNNEAEHCPQSPHFRRYSTAPPVFD